MAITDSIMASGYENYISATASQLGISLITLSIILAVIIVWVLIWKGVALWKAASKKSIIWFIILLAVNTIGILEILYIFVFSKMDEKKSVKRKARTR